MCSPNEGLFKLLLDSANNARLDKQPPGIRSKSEPPNYMNAQLLSDGYSPRSQNLKSNPMFPPNLINTPKTTVIKH